MYVATMTFHLIPRTLMVLSMSVAAWGNQPAMFNPCQANMQPVNYAPEELSLDPAVGGEIRWAQEHLKQLKLPTPLYIQVIDKTHGPSAYGQNLRLISSDPDQMKLAGQTLDDIRGINRQLIGSLIFLSYAAQMDLPSNFLQSSYEFQLSWTEYQRAFQEELNRQLPRKPEAMTAEDLKKKVTIDLAASPTHATMVAHHSLNQQRIVSLAQLKPSGIKPYVDLAADIFVGASKGGPYTGGAHLLAPARAEVGKIFSRVLLPSNWEDLVIAAFDEIVAEVNRRAQDSSALDLSAAEMNQRLIDRFQQPGFTPPP